MQTATLIDEYFTNIGPDLAKIARGLVRNNDQLNFNNLPNPDCPFFNYQHPPPELKEINNIKTFKTSGLPLVASRIWKIVFQHNPNLLQKIFDSSIDSNFFPTKWKNATVIPIPKVSKPLSPEDLRPISLLPLPGKIFEHRLHSQMDKFLERNSLLTKKQNGFRSKHSTIQTVFDFLCDLISSYNDQLDSIAIYIDFKKAFDTVNHALLLGKLPKFNFGANE